MAGKKQKLVARSLDPNRGNSVWIAMIVVGIALKFALLLTSQTLPDGDEAVEGLMAMHIVSKGVHPVYPYGVNYGAGAGWEAHLAAVPFLIFGPSTVALKSVGLFHYLITLMIVGAIAFKLGGKPVALIAMGLFATAPQVSQWALKVGGGHQVAIVLGLGGLACLIYGHRVAALALLPLAALAHPIVLPYSAVLCAGILITDKTWRDRLIHTISLGIFAGVQYLLLRPPEDTVWNPVSTAFEAEVRLLALPRLGIGLFCPNLNMTQLPLNWYGLFGMIWLVAFAWSLFHKSQPRWIQVALLGAAGILLIVRSHDLAPRHLLMASPLAVIAIACVPTFGEARRQFLLVALSLLGCVAHVTTMFDPCIYGPGNQSTGVDRANFASLMSKMDQENVRFVYCFDPMLQWNIDFDSREKVVARWMAPTDRVPEYVRAVDEAFRNGERVGVVAPMNQSPPIQYTLITDAVPRIVHEYFLTLPPPATELK